VRVLFGQRTVGGGLRGISLADAQVCDTEFYGRLLRVLSLQPVVDLPGLLVAAAILTQQFRQCQASF
jgi:hypothetical protein